MTAAGSHPPSAATRLPAMALLVTVAGTAAFGDAAAVITLMLRLYRADHPSWAITALLFCILGPSVLLAPFAARIMRRGGAARTLVLTSAGQVAATAGLIIVRGAAPTLALVAVIGAGLAMTQPALLEITPRAVGPDRLVWANSLIRAASWIGWTVGPVTGGALCAAGLASAALLTEAASFALAGVCFGVLGQLPAARARPSRPGQDGAGARVAVGYIRRDRVLAGLIASVGVTNVCVSMTGVAEVFLAREVLRAADTGFAFLSSAWFGGMVVGTLAAPRASAWRSSWTLPAGAALAGAGIIAAATAGGITVAIPAYGIAGIGFGLQATVVRAMIQRRADGPLRGPVCGIWVAVDMSTQLAGYLAGGAAMLAGARATLAIAGAGVCVVGGVALSRAGHIGYILREVPLEQP